MSFPDLRQGRELTHSPMLTAGTTMSLEAIEEARLWQQSPMFATSFPSKPVVCISLHDNEMRPLFPLNIHPTLPSSSQGMHQTVTYAINT